MDAKLERVSLQAREACGEAWKACAWRRGAFDSGTGHNQWTIDGTVQPPVTGNGSMPMETIRQTNGIAVDFDPPWRHSGLPARLDQRPESGRASRRARRRRDVAGPGGEATEHRQGDRLPDRSCKAGHHRRASRQRSGAEAVIRAAMPLCVGIWTTLVAANVVAAPPPSVNDAIGAYENAVARAEAGTAPHGVESVVEAVRGLEKVLFARGANGRTLVLELLSEADFAKLERLPGLFVRRIEVLVVQPKPDYMVALAARIGDEADRRFAAALAATYPGDDGWGGYWPVYVSPVTHWTGCTDFEDGKLLETYLAWSTLERDFPERYRSTVDEERKKVSDQIVRGTCACGDRASVVGELERILAALTPPDPVLAAVATRMAEIDQGQSPIRYHCRPR